MQLKNDKVFAFQRFVFLSTIYGLAVNDIHKENNKKKKTTISGKSIFAFFIWDTFMLFVKKYATTDILIHHIMCLILPFLQFIPHKDKYVYRQVMPYCILTEIMALIGFGKVFVPKKYHTFLRQLNILNSIFIRVPLWSYIGSKLVLPNLTNIYLKFATGFMNVSMLILDALWLKQMVQSMQF